MEFRNASGPEQDETYDDVRRRIMAHLARITGALMEASPDPKSGIPSYEAIEKVNTTFSEVETLRRRLAILAFSPDTPSNS